MSSTNGHGTKRAVLYARVSTEEQARSGYSLAQQIEALRQYAAREGYEVLEEVMDPGQSGASLERPGMDRVRDLVHRARAAMVRHRAPERKNLARSWELRGVLRCSCGASMGTHTATRQNASGKKITITIAVTDIQATRPIPTDSAWQGRRQSRGRSGRSSRTCSLILKGCALASGA